MTVKLSQSDLNQRELMQNYKLAQLKSNSNNADIYGDRKCKIENAKF